MSYGDLKDDIAAVINRIDADTLGRIPGWVQDIHTRLVETVGALDPLVADTDTNALLTYDRTPYLYGAVAEAAAYLRDDEMLAVYGAKFAQRVQRLRATGLNRLRVNLCRPTP